jgi:hypothetical protein
MDKKDRIIVHEIANAFSLKSKSTGSATSRYPTVYKTLKSRNWHRNLDEAAFDAIEARLARRNFGRRSGGGTGSGVVRYRDGDIVGGTAPELGVENKGRAMLEKMGWSSGTALGALNNKGILQPVTHVVKTSKAGLG